MKGQCRVWKQDSSKPSGWSHRDLDDTESGAFSIADLAVSFRQKHCVILGDAAGSTSTEIFFFNRSDEALDFCAGGYTQFEEICVNVSDDRREWVPLYMGAVSVKVQPHAPEPSVNNKKEVNHG